MFNWIINTVAGNYNERQIKHIMPLVQKVNNISDTMDAWTDDEIKARSNELKDIVSKITLPKKIKDKEGNLKLESTESPLDDYLPEAFALVKQAAKRLVGTSYMVKGTEQVWNMVPYDVQIVGGINLHKGKISEMKTGEGKTLVATMPAYLNALTGRGVHVITVNDYLASRDSDQMRILFEFLGLTVGCVTKATPPQLRRQEYEKDITYVENSELGFDYLRDNLVKSLDERSVLWRPLYYGIVDEVDSILIDESRTPLIISEPDSEPTEKYAYYAQIVPSLIASKTKKKVSKGFLAELINKDEKDENPEDIADYFIDEKLKTVSLSSQGIEKLEKTLNVENLYRDLGYEEIHHIENALKAYACYQNGKEYLVNNGEVIIVDENTGRAQPGRRFSQGLHQAIEAKENVTIQRESKTLATITYQNFFKLYYKLAGMTGTATTEGEEFDSIYDLSVLAIPTNKPVIRVDINDKVFFNQNAKWKAVVDQIDFSHSIGQPLLIGTSSIHTSEFVSTLLSQRNIKHSVLNAKYHEQEANIVSRAGQLGSVVVATNMAGRGTDIKLENGLNDQLALNYAQWIEHMISGNNIAKTNHQVRAKIFSEYEYELTIDALKNQFSDLNEDIIIASYKNEQSFSDYKIRIVLNTKKKFAYEVYADIIISHKDASLSDTIERSFHYGLGIIGTEKHESRRIDNQLRGRAGRQGDAGFSVFYVALDDTIMRKMGGEKIQGVASLLLPKAELENIELTQSQFTNAIIRAQKQLEGRHFSTRKHLFDYDSVINKQRQSIYGRRDDILHTLHDIYHPSDNTSETKKANVDNLISQITALVQGSVEKFLTTQQTLGLSKDEIIDLINKDYALSLDEEHIKESLYNQSTQHITAHILSKLSDARDLLGDDIFVRVCANIYLTMIDRNWVEHIDEMQYLREKVGLVGYAQLDPLVIYKKESYSKYQALNTIINQSTVSILANTNFEQISENIKRQQEQQLQIIEEQQTSQQDILAKLKSAANTSPKIQVQPQTTVNIIQNEVKHSKESLSDSEFEIIEVDNNSPSQGVAQQTFTIQKSGKLRPNDKVTVRYSDGKVEFDVKYKKVADDIKSGKAEII